MLGKGPDQTVGVHVDPIMVSSLPVCIGSFVLGLPENRSGMCDFAMFIGTGAFLIGGFEAGKVGLDILGDALEEVCDAHPQHDTTPTPLQYNIGLGPCLWLREQWNWQQR